MDRRRFLSRAVGALGATGLGACAAPRQRFEDRLGALRDPLAADCYGLTPGIAYLNHANIGTVPRLVGEAHRGYLEACETNPSHYMFGGVWDAAVQAAREGAARYLGCRADEVVLNRNTTDGFNVLAAGLALERGDEVLFSNLNHVGASVCWQHFAGQRGYVVRKFELPLPAVPDMNEAELVDRHVKALGPRTRVLVLPHIDNLLGVRTPVARIAAAARQRGVEFVLADGAQVAGMLPVDLANLGVDAYCMSPHKWLQAPKGLGLLFLSRKIQPKVTPQVVTWGQHKWEGSVRRFEDYGTRDLPALLALGDAIAYQQAAGIERSAMKRATLWRHARDRVAAEPNLIWRSPRDWNLGGALFAIEVRGAAAEPLAEQAWERQRVVTRAFPAPGLNTLRVSPNALNTTAELDRLFDVLARYRPG
ncbi:MAG: aminotransferase class V-fold PLP-dependent enzyme [Planctomycetes bacterium]|nr:aminotransferase class V-fold PLP-dependent enzyme [Planctomycetota bacterium]